MKVLRKKVDMFEFSLYVIMKSIREELMSLSLNLGTGMSPSPYMMNPMNYSALGSTPYQQYMFNQQAMQAQMQTPQPQIPAPVQPQMQAPQQPVQMPQMRAPDFTGSFVESYEEVKSYPIPINGVLLLMNKNSNRFYIKTLNDIGVPVVKTFEFNELLSNGNEEAQDNKGNSTSNVETTSNDKSNIEERVSLLERTVASYKAMLLDKFKNNTGLNDKEETK